jgi:hypothetical protein
MSSQVLFTLNRLKICGALEQQLQSVPELSRLLNFPENSLLITRDNFATVGAIRKAHKEFGMMILGNEPFSTRKRHGAPMLRYLSDGGGNILWPR